MPFDSSYTEDSGFYTNFTGTIVDSYAAKWEKATKQDDWFAFFIWDVDDDPDRSEHQEIRSLGKGWASEDGGRTVRNDQGAKAFNARYSDYKKWINAAIPLIIEAGFEEEISGRGPATDLTVWKGTRWSVEPAEESYFGKNPETDAYDVPKKRTINVPSAFLGLVDGSNNGKANTVDLTFIPDKHLAAVVKVAKAAPNRQSFVDRVMLDVPEVQQTEGLLGKLAGSGVYDALAAS